MISIKKPAAILLAMLLSLFYGCIRAESFNCSVNLYPIRENGKWGFMNEVGDVVIAPAYDAVSDCVNGYIAVSNDDYWGIINSVGESIVPIEYRIEWQGNSSVFVVKDINDRLALFFTETGILSDFIWKNVKFEKGKTEFPVQSSNGLWGYVDAKGDGFISYRFLNADPFNEGWAGVEVYNIDDRWFTYDALVNQSGELLFPPEGYSIMKWDGVNEGLIQIKDNDNGLVGFMNMQGKIVIQPTWEDARAFHGMFAAVRDFSTDTDYYIDRSGKILDTTIHPPAEGDDSSTSFSYGVTTVFVESYDGFEPAIMDETGSILFVNHGNDIAWIFHYFDTDHAWYVNNNGLYGLIDRYGQIITDADYGCFDENGSPFTEGVAPVVKDGLWGYIDSDGIWAITPKWEKAWPFHNGLAKVERNKLFMYIDHEENIIWSEK